MGSKMYLEQVPSCCCCYSGSHALRNTNLEDVTQRGKFQNCCLGKSITPSPAYLLLFLINKLMNSIFMSLLTPWTSLLWNPYLYCSSETQSPSRIMAIFFSTQNSSTKKKSDFILDRYTWTQPKKYWQHTLLSGFFSSQ